MNLLDETLEVLKDHDKTPADVKWCGSEEWGWFTWEDFKKLADIIYDNGFGAQKIATDLLIVGDDWWLERGEYDGAEYWQYKTLPKKPENYKVPKTLKVAGKEIGWLRLSHMELNGGAVS